MFYFIAHIVSHIIRKLGYTVTSSVANIVDIKVMSSVFFLWI